VDGTTPVRMVVDTGRLRAQLRAAAGALGAEQLAVLVDTPAGAAIVAASRPLLEAHAGERPALRTPIVREGREVAVLQALRRPGDAPFRAPERAALEDVAARLGHALDVTDPAA
jgi:hypothetical protein